MKPPVPKCIAYICYVPGPCVHIHTIHFTKIDLLLYIVYLSCICTLIMCKVYMFVYYMFTLLCIKGIMGKSVKNSLIPKKVNNTIQHNNTFFNFSHQHLIVLIKKGFSVQGISKKCTGAFKFGCCIIF